MEDKIKNYIPLSNDLFIEESMIDGQGLFASTDIPKGTDLGISHVEIEKDKMSPKEIIRTPLGGFINHQDYVYIEEGGLELTGPNCEKIKQKPDGNKTEWNLITRKDIKAGQELTLEYTFYKII
jgi:hypothetical protein